MKGEEVLEQVGGCIMCGAESNLSRYCSLTKYGDFND